MVISTILSESGERMADGRRIDVLRFVDVPVEQRSAWGPGQYASRQIEVNGQLLGELLTVRTGSPVVQSTPLVDGHVGVISPAAYLRALLGGPKDDPLLDGRIALGYCDACLDGTCGTLLGATLGVEGGAVIWSAIGFERFDDGQAPKLTPFWKKASTEDVVDAPPPWTPAPFVPDITFYFDRDRYLETLQAERRRLAASQ
jgi:hypothetical protein